MNRLAWDSETYRIGPQAVFPRPICFSFAQRPAPDSGPASFLVASGDPTWAKAAEWILDQALDHGTELVTHNGPSFDYAVLAAHFPHLMSKLWKVFERGLVRDTMIREMLLNLALHGFVDSFFLPDGTNKKVSYSLEKLAHKHLGLEMKNKAAKGKKGEVDEGQDVWQLHYDMLDGLPAASFPEDAARYAKDDALITLAVSEKQDEIAAREFHDFQGPDGKPFDVFGTEWLHAGAAFALTFTTQAGFGVDRSEVVKMKAAVEQALRPEQTRLLYESEILRPAKPPRPYANGALNPDGTPKMTKGEEASRNMARLMEIVVSVHEENARCDEDGCPQFGGACEDHSLMPLRRTEPSKKFPVSEDNPDGGQISTDAEAIAGLTAFSPLLAQYEHYTGLGKLQTQEIPLLEGTDRIRGAYEILKKTGRVSCRKSKNFPSRNLQQVPRGFEIFDLDENGHPRLDGNGKPIVVARVEPRRCYTAPIPDWVICSIDFSYLELCTLAQTTFREFGHSRLRTVVNDGHDPHAWLGAQLAYGSDQDFQYLCAARGAEGPDARYKIFESLKQGNDALKSFFRKFRGLAKPTGLALGGGMGAKRLRDYAKQTYNVLMTLEEAKLYKEIWLTAFPEMREYLNRFIRERLVDPRHGGEVGTDGKKRERYACFSPFGMYRSCGFYTDIANHFALQGPAADGGKLAVWDVVRACWDPSVGSDLYGQVLPLAFVHDELLVSFARDGRMHEKAFDVSKRMVSRMRVVCPDILVKAEPAVSERWEKGAEPVYDAQERLDVWRAGVKYRMDERGRLRSA